MALDVDLFAGAGGLAVGIGMAGFKPVELYELDSHSCETLRQNISCPTPSLFGKVHEGDVSKVKWRHLASPVRLLAAGSPCQPFSLGGKHLAEHDGRNLFPEVIRAVRELRPAAVLVENVRGLLRTTFRPYFEYLLRQLECPSLRPKPHELWVSHDKRIRRQQCSLGYEPEYHVSWRLVDAADYGVPQNRQRVFLVATRLDLPPYQFPKPTHSKNALVWSQQFGDYWIRHCLQKPKERFQTNGDTPTQDGLLPWVTVRDALAGLPKPSPAESGSSMNHWAIPGARVYAGHAGSILDWPSKTIKAGVHGVPGGENVILDGGKVRYYTLREAARIQTFADTHVFSGARIHVTRQIGNAVPCRLASSLTAPLLNILQAGIQENGVTEQVRSKEIEQYA